MSEERDEAVARIAALEAELTHLRATVDVLAQWGLRYGLKFPDAAKSKSAPPAPASLAASGAQTVHAASGSAAASTATASQASQSTAAGTRTAAAAKKPPGTEQLLIFTMYGVGLFVLLIGAAVILPATLGAVGPAARAIIGLLIGFGLLAFGARGARRTWIADGFVALGAALEYLSLWSAHHEHLVPVAPLFALMVATTGFVGALAYVHRSERLAFAGLAGGAIVPLLVADSQAHPFGLCVYLGVLTAFALALVRNFRYLEFAVFALLMLYSPAWAFGPALSEEWTSLDALGATAVFFAELAGAVLYGSRRGSVDLARNVLFALEIGAFAAMLDQRPAGQLVPYLVARAAFATILLGAAQLRPVAASLREICAWWGLGGTALLVQSRSPNDPQANDGNQQIAFDATRARWLRLRFYDTRAPFGIGGIYVSSTPDRDALIPMQPRYVFRATVSNRQIWTFRFGGVRVPVAGVRLTGAPRAAFAREVSVAWSADGESFDSLGTMQTLGNRAADVTTTETFEEVPARAMQVTIDNGSIPRCPASSQSCCGGRMRWYSRRTPHGRTGSSRADPPQPPRTTTWALSSRRAAGKPTASRRSAGSTSIAATATSAP